MSDSQNNTIFSDPSLTTEELLGPPKIDLTGYWLMLIMSLVVGLLAWVGFLLFAFLTAGQFSISTGVSPILLAMITFFCLTFANYLYTLGLSIIFPHIYTRVRTMFVQISIFSGILYVVMAGLYLIINTIYNSSTAILWAYAFHVVFNTFWLLLLTGIIAQYRYSLLIFYSNFISLILTGLIISWVYNSFTSSWNALFILMWIVTVCFFMSTFVTFLILWAYYQMYKTLWFDPLGNVFADIEKEEKDIEKQAENILLGKK